MVGVWELPYLNNEFLGSRTFSLSFLSSLSATISAAFPLGQRIIGTEPILSIGQYSLSNIKYTLYNTHYLIIQPY